MARNISDAILRLDLEVVGLENLKSATAAIERQQRVAAEQRPSVMKTIILVEDLGGTVLSKNKLNWKELQQAVQGATAAMGLAVDAYNRRLNSLLVTTTRAIRAGALNESATRYGLYPPDVSTYRRLDVLQGQAIQGNRLLGAFGSNRIVGSPERGYTPVGLDLEERVTKVITNLARMGPQLGFPQLRQLRSLSQGGVSDENAPELQALIATIAPQIAVSRLIAKMTGGLRATLGAAPGPNLPLTKQSAFDLRALNPGAVAKIERALQAEGPEVLYTNAATPSLNAIALALTQVPRRRPLVQGGKIENVDDLSIALSAARAEFGTPPEDVKYYRDASGRLYNQPPQQLFATERGTGRRIATSRPKIEDITTSSGLLVSGRTGLPIQPQMALPLPMTAIETTGRVISPEMESEAARIEQEIAASKTAFTKRMAELQGRGMFPGSSRIQGLFSKVFAPLENEFGFARIRGRGKGSISKQAMDLLENIGKPDIFPSVFSKMLNVEPSVGKTLIESMQKEGYLGPSVGNYAIPIIDAQARRTMQAQWEIEQLKLTEDAEKEAQTARGKVRAAEKKIKGDEAVASETAQKAASLADVKWRRTGKAVSPFMWNKTGPDIPPSIMAGFLTGGRQGPEPEFFGAEGQQFGGTSIGPSNWFGGGGAGFGGGGVTSMFGTPISGGGGGGGKGGGFFSGRLANRFAGLAAFVTSAAIIYPIASTIFSTIGAASQLQTELTRIQAIYGSHTLSDQLTIKADVIQAARALGEDVNQVAQAAQSFAQSGVNIAQLGANLQAAAVGAKAFGTNIKEVADYIIGVGESSKGRIGPMQAVDLLAAIQRKTNVSGQILAQSIQAILPTLEPFAPAAGGIPDEALIGAITGVTKQTTGTNNVRTALNFFTSQLGNPKQLSRLERITGEGLGTAESHGQELRPFIEILDLLAKTYQHLINTGQSAQAKELIKEFFGARQGIVGTAILSEWDKILLVATDGIKGAGAAAEIAKPQIETFSSRFSRLKTDLTGFWGNFLDGAGDVIGALDDILDKLHQMNAKDLAKAESGEFATYSRNDPFSRFVRFNANYNPKAPIFEAFPQSIQRESSPATKDVFDILTGNLNKVGTPGHFFNTLNNLGPATNMFKSAVPSPTRSIMLGGPAPAATVGKTKSVPADTGKELQDWLDKNEKVTKEIAAQTLIWDNLGGAQNKAQIALKLYTKQLEDYYALPEARQKEKRALVGETIGERHAPGFLELQEGFRDARRQVIREAMEQQEIRNESSITKAIDAATRSVTRIQLRALVNRSEDHGPEAIQAEMQLIDLETEELKIQEQIEFKEAVRLTDDTKELAILGVKHENAIALLDIANRRLKVEVLLTQQIEDQIKLEQRQRQETQALIGAAFKGLQDLPKALEQARAQHKNMLGAGITAIFGPVAESLGANRAREISEIFKNANFGGRLGGTSKIDAQIQQAQDAYKNAVLGQRVNEKGQQEGLAPGQIEGLSKEIARLKKVKEKQILEQQLAISGGEIITAVTGGNTQNAQIGGEIGGAVGNLIVPGIGGIIGGGLGSLIGGLFGRHKPQPTIGHLQIIAENTREQVKLLENTNKLLEVNFVSFNVPTGFRLPSYQPGSFGGVGGLRGAGGGVVNSNIAVNVSVGGTNVSADKLGNTIAQAISDRLELETRTGGNYFPRLLYG